MNAHARKFVAAPAVREQVPLLIGLMGPSGGGKTFSALRLATGIQKVVGGEIDFIDTEAKRALHYADQFKFNHVPFGEPFGSLDYLDAIRFCVGRGSKTVIIDSMSHEHEGVGGLLDYHEREVDRMAGDNYSKREAVKILAWGKPKAARRQLINALLQMECNFIFCFRAKNSVKPMKVRQDSGQVKTEVVPQGFMPIAGEEFVFEMTMNALLLPGAGGVPTWNPENVGEKVMTKLPEQFRHLMTKPKPLDEDMGIALATWARGGSTGGAAQDRARTAAQAQSMPLPDRIAAFRERVAAAHDLIKLQAVERASASLRAVVQAEAPDELKGMDEAIAARRADLGGSEKKPLRDRVAAFMAEVTAATTIGAAKRLADQNKGLWDEVDAGDPDLVGTTQELDDHVNARCDAIEAEEQKEPEL